MWYTWKILIFAGLLCVQARVVINNTNLNQNTCRLSTKLVDEIDSYTETINNILETATIGKFKNKTWNDLAFFVDSYYPRFVGNKALNNSIEYVFNVSKELNFNVSKQLVRLPHWVRGTEFAILTQPQTRNLEILGLVGSVGTNRKGLVASVIVVNNITDLENWPVAGNIVVLNQKFEGYNETMKIIYRVADIVHTRKGVALLVRSVTPISVYTPHTGRMIYYFRFDQIPVAFITVEDAVLLRRLQDRNKHLEIKLRLDGGTNFYNVSSYNTIVEYPGNVMPNKTFIMSGHIDAMDVGEGAMDGSGGVMIPWTALKLLQHLNLTARRTIRMVLHTGNKIGYIGSHKYVREHKKENGSIQFILESSVGAFLPTGIAITGSKSAKCVLQRILSIIASLLPQYHLELVSPLQDKSDVTLWQKLNVPCGRLMTLSKDYPIYRDSYADSMLPIKPETLDMNTAIFAAMSYVLANISYDLPRNDITVSNKP